MSFHTFTLKAVYLVSFMASFVFAGYGLANNSFLELQIFLTGFGTLALMRLLFDKLVERLKKWK